MRNSTRLLTANVIAQAVGLLVYPILTRIYSADDFGLLNLFMSIGGILAIISTAEYQNAIVLPKDNERAHALGLVCMAILCCMTIVLLMTIPFSSYISLLFKIPDLARWWWLMPVYVFALGGWQIARNCLLRYKSYKNLSGYQYSQILLGVGGKLGFGISGFLSGGLIVASVVAPLVSLCISVGAAWNKVFRGMLCVNGKQCIAVAKAYRNFPCFSLPRSFVNTFSGNLPALILTPVFGLTEMGYFGMALTLSFMPINMIVQSVYQVLYQRAAQLVNEHQRIGRLVGGYVMKAFVVLLPSFALLYFVLPVLTSWLLGNEWNVSGEYIRLLLPWLLMIGVTSPVGFLSDIFGKQKVALGIEIIYLLLRLGVLAIGVVIGDFRLTLLLYSLAGSVVIAGQLIWYMWLVRCYHRSLKVD